METLDLVGTRLKDRDDEAATTLKKETKAMHEALTGLGEHFAGKQVQGIHRDPSTVMALMYTARGYITSGMNAPDPSATVAMEHAQQRLSEALDAVNTFFATDWAAYEQAVRDADVELFAPRTPLTLTTTASEE